MLLELVDHWIEVGTIQEVSSIRFKFGLTAEFRERVFVVEIVETINEVRDAVAAWRKAGLSVGLVPTMGYLHEGHQSLIRQAAQDNDRVVVSVFVNPTQFGEGEDLESYPRDINRDKAACEEAGATLIFHPSVDEMYYPDRSTTIHMADISEELCGKSRPIHFDGVCLVVNKLFNIVQPDRAYFGQKDAQQLLVVRRMVRDLNNNVEVIGCPIIREEDGLAKSSRNTYLSSEERKAAPVLYRALVAGKNLCEAGERNTSVIKQAIAQELDQEPLANPEYIEIVSTDTVKPIDHISGEVLCALAVRIGKTRLIDNFFFTA